MESETMMKNTKIIVGIIIIVSIVTIYLQYQSNKRLKNSLGQVYASNIGEALNHMDRVEYYLNNENTLNESELDKYFSEINLMRGTGISSDYMVDPYLQYIQSGLHRMKLLAANKGSNEEIESARTETLKLIVSLKSGLNKMYKVGDIIVGNEHHYDYKKYYELSLEDNKIINEVNEDLQKQLEKHFEYLNAKQK
jgi:hypothetical protein